MSLVIPFDPAGLDARVVGAFDDVIAPIQTAFGRFEATGRWVTPTHDPNRFHIAGAGNSWTDTGRSQSPFSYTLLNDSTMIVNIDVLNSTLTIALSTILNVVLPDGFMTTGSTNSRVFRSVGFLQQGGTSVGSLMQAPAGSNYIAISPIDGSSLATSTLQVSGQLALEVTRQ